MRLINDAATGLFRVSRLPGEYTFKHNCFLVFFLNPAQIAMITIAITSLKKKEEHVIKIINVQFRVTVFFLFLKNMICNSPCSYAWLSLILF